MVSGHAIDLAKPAASASLRHGEWPCHRPREAGRERRPRPLASPDRPLLGRTALFAGHGGSGAPGTALLRLLQQKPRSRSYGLKRLAGGRGRPRVGGLNYPSPPGPSPSPQRGPKAAPKRPPATSTPPEGLTPPHAATLRRSWAVGGAQDAREPPGGGAGGPGGPPRPGEGALPGDGEPTHQGKVTRPDTAASPYGLLRPWWPIAGHDGLRGPKAFQEDETLSETLSGRRHTSRPAIV